MSPEENGDGGSEGRWPRPQSALETAPTLTEQARPPCKHRPQRKGGRWGVLGSSSPARSTLLNKVIIPPQPRPISGSPHPEPQRKQFEKSENGDSELPAAVSEEALGRLGLAEGDGDGVGGDISHCHFTGGEHRSPGRGPLGQVCICYSHRRKTDRQTDRWRTASTTAWGQRDGGSMQATAHPPTRLSAEPAAKSEPSPALGKGEGPLRLSFLARPERVLSGTTERALGGGARAWPPERPRPSPAGRA